MIGSFLKPKHTFIGVANQIRKELEEETVYLNDVELKNSGYEIHEFEVSLFSWKEELLMTAYFTIVYVVTVLLPFAPLICIVDNEIYSFSSLNLSNGTYESVNMEKISAIYENSRDSFLTVVIVFYAMIHIILYRIFHRILPRVNRRFITKKSVHAH